jgi:hypothetical protein
MLAVRQQAVKGATAAAEILEQGLHLPILVAAAAVAARAVLAEMPAVLVRLKAARRVVQEFRTAFRAAPSFTLEVAVVVDMDLVRLAWVDLALVVMAGMIPRPTQQAAQSIRAAAAVVTVSTTPRTTAEVA